MKHLYIGIALFLFLPCAMEGQVFEEIDGVVAVEAEHFFEQTHHLILHAGRWIFV